MNNIFLFFDWVENWSLFWTGTGTLIALLSFIGLLVKKIFIDPYKEENQRLRNEIDTRLQYPSYGLETAKLTELQMNRKIDEIKNKYEIALKDKDEKLAKKLAEHIQEIENLKSNLDRISKEHLALKEDLDFSLPNVEYVHSGNALRLPTGFILLIKCNGKFGALKAIDQSFKRGRGAFIKYYWWYQPNGSGIFTTAEVKSGYDYADESGKKSYLLNIGPIALHWSSAGEGLGWVYFKNENDSGAEIELVVSDEIDITKINAGSYEFLKPYDGEPKHIKLRKN